MVFFISLVGVAWLEKNVLFTQEPNQNFPLTVLNFSPFLYAFLYFRGTNSLQMSKLPGNQVPEFPIFPDMLSGPEREICLFPRECS